MLHKLRSKTQSWSAKLPTRSESIAADFTIGDNSNMPRSSLLGLPAELRNQIYEYVASDTSILLPPTKVYKPPPRPAALLLACKQTSREFWPILLANAAMVVEVLACDFAHLKRVCAALDVDGLTALSLNSHITIVLWIANVPSIAERGRVREWCQHRATAPEQRKLHFDYEAKITERWRPPKLTSRYVIASQQLRVYQGQQDLILAHMKHFGDDPTVTPPTSDQTPANGRTEGHDRRSSRFYKERRRLVTGLQGSALLIESKKDEVSRLLR